LHSGVILNKTKKKPLRILLTNHHLISYQGSENFTFTIADFLTRNGHQVTVYSAYVDQLRNDFENLGITIVSDLKLLKEQSFDLAHVHHHINAYEIRYYFPHLPIVLLCHGVPFLEHPPALDLKISQYLATSERVRECMATKGVAKDKIIIFRNMVDSEKFYPRSEISPKPRRALIISNKIDSDSENVIRQACEALKISCVFIGQRFRPVDYHQMPLLLNEADIVFSLGRGVIEAMLCGRIPVVFDYEGGDGMVTPSTIMQNVTCNFSGNLHNAHYTVDELISILSLYQADDALQLRQIALENFAASNRIGTLLDIYYKHIDTKVDELSETDKSMLASFVLSIGETRNYAAHCQRLEFKRNPKLPLLRRVKRFLESFYLSA
jgi:glycosyltransferase involved in cell wall biosynthesis